MKKFIAFLTTITFIWFVPVSHLLANNFISEPAAVQCIQLNKNMDITQQKIRGSESKKASLKSKINYLTTQIHKHRSLIEELDQQHNQLNNDNYNQLIDQFDALMEERKETISLYNTTDTQHLHLYEKQLELDKGYTAQCLDNIQVNKDVFKMVCGFEKTGWCGLFSF